MTDAEKNKLKRYGLSGLNKPKRSTSGGNSHVVAVRDNGRIKIVRFGQAGVKTNQTAGQREAFKSRHRKNIAKGRTSAAWWSNKIKWSPSKTKSSSRKWVKGS